VKEFPRVIFPAFPAKIGEETAAELPLGSFNGRTSPAVNIMCKFLRSFLHEVKSNLKVQQSEILLNFLELMCPIKAVEHDRVEQLTRLLQMSVDFNKHDAYGYTALHQAVSLDRIEAVKWLINCSTVHINSKDNNGNTPLVLAIKFNKPHTAKLLIEAGADVKVKNNVRSSPLHIAAARGLTEICRILIEKGAKVDELNLKKKAPIHYAIVYQWVDVVMLLLQNGANPTARDAFGNTLLSLATAAGLESVVNYLLSNTSINVNDQGRHQSTALHLAAAAGRVAIAKVLLEYKANPLLLDINNYSPVYTSVGFRNHEVLDLLCSSSLDIIKNALISERHNGENMIHVAADSSANSGELISLLAKNGVDVYQKVCVSIGF
jgi:ankyrin repeat protein